MTKNISIREFITRFDNGEFDNPSFETQVAAGWYDWFCKEASLANKTKRLAACVKSIANSPKVNQDTMYVFFKNNCPVCGSLYDSFSICDLESGDVLFWVTPSNGHDGPRKGKPQVAVVAGGYAENEFDNWSAVKRWFNEA